DLSAANTVKIKVAAAGTGGGTSGGTGGAGPTPPNVRVAAADFEPSQIQDLGDLIPTLLEIKAKAKIGMKFQVRLELGDGTTPPSDEVVSEINERLKELGDEFRVG